MNKDKSYDFYIRKPKYKWKCDYCDFKDSNKTAVIIHENNCAMKRNGIVQIKI